MEQERLIKVLWIIKAGLVAVLLYVGFGVVVNRVPLDAVLDPGTAHGELHVAEAPAAPLETHSPSDYEVIVQRNLFSDAAATAGPRPDANRAPAAPAAPSADELGLKLVGTIAGGPTASRAIIQDTRNNTSDFYRIGDTVASATVEAVQRGQVVLRYQGRSLVLKQCSGTPADTGPKTPAAPPKAESPSSPPVATAPSSESSRAAYMSEVFRKATIEPYVRNDRTEGLRITGLDKIPLAEAFGFKNGDIVQAVNGQQLTSKQKAFQVLQKAKTQPRVNIRILRDGQSKELSFDL